MDSGHFPLMGIYLAVLWSVFGKSLLVSHLAMLPFLLGAWYFLLRVGHFFLGENTAWLLVVFTFLDPVFAGQTVLVTPDIAVICFFLAALDAVLQQRKIRLAVSAILLAALSMRGMMIVLALYFFSLAAQVIVSGKSPFTNPKKAFLFLWKNAVPFIPSGLLSLAFLAAHYQHAGWVGYHADSPWASAFVKVDFQGFVKNCAVLTWRILDFGRVFLLLIAFFFFLKFYARGKRNGFPKKSLLAVSLIGTCTVCLTPSVLIHQGLLLHRYLLPLLFALNLSALYLIVKSKSTRKNLLLGLAFIGLSTGNLWVYPKGIAQGWDATLAHIPYYSLRAEMIDYLEQEGIDFATVGSAFPNISGFEYIDLSPRTKNFSRYNIEESKYILYSNVMNDFTDSEIEALEEDWREVKKIRSGGVCFILYER